MFQFFVTTAGNEFTFVECEGDTELKAMRLLALKIIVECYEAWDYGRAHFEQEVRVVLDAEDITTIQELMKKHFQIEAFSAYKNKVSLEEFQTPGL